MANCYSDDGLIDFEIDKVPIPESVELSGDDSWLKSNSIATFSINSPERWMDDKQSDINPADIEYNRKYPTKVHEAFTLEEIVSNDLEHEDAQKQTIKPDEYEEADSSQISDDEIDEDSDIANGIRRLSCQDEPHGLNEEQISRYIQKKKKWRARDFKRSHSQSLDDEVDMTDRVEVEGCQVDHVHRRLRRRINDSDEGVLILKGDAAHVEVSDLDEQMEIED